MPTNTCMYKSAVARLDFYKLTCMANHICRFCGMEFETGFQLGNHIAKKCDKNPNRGRQKNLTKQYNWTCKCCGKVCESRRKLREHYKTHNDDDCTKSKFSHNVPVTSETCKYCGRTCKSVSGLHLHEKCCDKNPNRIYLAKQSVVMTDITKEKISKALKKYYEGKTIWYTSEKMSYAERYFSKIFTDASHNYHVDRYFLDFAWVDKKLYVEVDGEQHYTPKGIAHDNERTTRLLKCGWRLLARIRWSSYNKLDKNERKKFVKELIDKVRSADIV